MFKSLLFLLILTLLIKGNYAQDNAILLNENSILFSNNGTFLNFLRTNLNLETNVVKSGTNDDYYKRYGNYNLQFPNLAKAIDYITVSFGDYGCDIMAITDRFTFFKCYYF